MLGSLLFSSFLFPFCFYFILLLLLLLRVSFLSLFFIHVFEDRIGYSKLQYFEFILFRETRILQIFHCFYDSKISTIRWDKINTWDDSDGARKSRNFEFLRYFLKILQLNNYDENKREEIGSISSSLRDERNFLYIIFTIRKFHTTMKRN